jgi:hypothetical protein
MTVRILGRDLTVTCGTEEMAGKPVEIPGARRPEGGPSVLPTFLPVSLVPLSVDCTN